MTRQPLQGRLILLGITGSIAAYKGAELLRELTRAGAEVQVMMSEAATHFIGPLTLEALSGRAVMLDPLELQSDSRIGHIVAADSADAILVAPATARWLGAMANGLANDIITATCLASSAPVVVAPAMDGDMYMHPATVANVARLREYGYTVVDPDSGSLASGQEGVGRLAELPRLVDAVARVLDGQPIRQPDPAGPTTPRRARPTRPGRLAHRRQRRRHGRADRSGALHRQPLQRQDGHGHRRGSSRSWCARDPHQGHHHRRRARGRDRGAGRDSGPDARSRARGAARPPTH